MPPLAVRPGAYRWFYADARVGELTVVCIFMVGAVFSPRALIAAERGVAPAASSAVNCALYRGGRRVAWVFTEHPRAEVDGDVLRIGRSTFGYARDGVVVTVAERTAPFGRPVRLDLTLVPEAGSAPPVVLHPGGPHEWQALVPRARATLTLPDDGVIADGVGYHDTNHGARRLGVELPGWRWTRAHARGRTDIVYQPPGDAVVVRERDGDVALDRRPPSDEPSRRSRWRLSLPERLDGNVPRVLESSPFYARLETEGRGVHALGEVADFRRFAQPWIRWMAHFRLRAERTT